MVPNTDTVLFKVLVEVLLENRNIVAIKIVLKTG